MPTMVASIRWQQYPVQRWEVRGNNFPAARGGIINDDDEKEREGGEKRCYHRL